MSNFFFQRVEHFKTLIKLIHIMFMVFPFISVQFCLDSNSWASNHESNYFVFVTRNRVGLFNSQYVGLIDCIFFFIFSFLFISFCSMLLSFYFVNFYVIFYFLNFVTFQSSCCLFTFSFFQMFRVSYLSEKGSRLSCWIVFIESNVSLFRTSVNNIRLDRLINIL